MVQKNNRLQKIRRLRKFLVFSVALLTGSVLLFYMTPWSAGVREVIVLAGVAVYSVATLSVVFVKCPRCGHLFHNVLGFNNPLSRFCSHCGLSLEGDDPA